MKISDMMSTKKIVDDDSELSCLRDNDEVASFCQADIARLTSLIRVMDAEGRDVGSVGREVLQFLNNACDSWAMVQIIDRFHDCIIAVDHAGRVFFVNDAYTKTLGVAKHHILGKKIQDIEPGAAVVTVLETGEPILEKAVHVKSINHHVVVNIYPIKREGRLAGVVSIFRDVTETRKLTQALDRVQGLAEHFRTQLEEKDQLANSSIIGKHSSFLKVLSKAMTVAKTDASILITGENGVGKEVLVKAIHQNSNRRDKPLISVNCAAIPESLLESELFGFEGGTFTGAKKGGKLGKFELADGGTIFLDEVGDMPLIMQSKLLRVLQEKEIEKIGRTHNISINVRVIAATNRPLEQMVQQGKFRNDLYYRLNVVAITIPPLREREDDIGLLAHHFLMQNNDKYGKKLRLSLEILQFFHTYDWPGNIRELQNCIEYAVIMCSDPELRIEHLPSHMNKEVAKGILNQGTKRLADIVSLRENQQEIERMLIEEALAECNNNKSAAMKRIGISRRTFYRKLREYGYLSPR
jgi:PAS domain S-box-containing protein